ncbi:MAG: response regulator, partial [bacterium]
MGYKILVADDSRTMRRAFQIVFAKEDVELLLAEAGDAAIDMARRHNPDLVLADHRMPGSTGYEVCDAIKSDPQLGHIRVIICCSNQDPFDAQRGAKADGSLLKPFDSTKLIELVQETLAKGPAVGPSASAPVAAPAPPAPPAPRAPAPSAPPAAAAP